jgi:hypothetical protein
MNRVFDGETSMFKSDRDQKTLTRMPELTP